MRSHEFISEKQYPLRSGSTVDIAINPTHRKIGSMLRDHGCVRGGIMDGRLFVWDGWFSSHQEIQRSMDWHFDSLLVFYETLDQMGRDLDWTQSQIYKEDGFYFVISPGLSMADRRLKVLANGVSIGYFEHRENRASGGNIELKDEYSHISFYESLKVGEIAESIMDTPTLGCWIEPNGEIHKCDHDKDWHHADIALDNFDVDPDDNGIYDEYSRQAALDAAKEDSWLRISAMDTMSLSIDWSSSLTPQQKTSLLSVIADARKHYFTNYYIEAGTTFLQFDNFNKFYNELKRLISGRTGSTL